MDIFQIYVAVLFCSLPFTSGADSLLNYDLCEKGDIKAFEGKISFNSSSVGRQEKNSACERIIYTSKGRLMLTLTHSVENQDVLQVIDGAFGEQKIISSTSKAGKIYESTGNAIRIILNVKNTSKPESLGPIEGTFTTIPFRATCSCSGIQNGHVNCRDSYFERKCTVKCQQDYIDLFNSTGIFTCDLVNGKWNKEYKNTVGCVQTPSLPVHVLQVNFTIQNLTCDARKNNYISKVLLDYLFTQEAIKENSACFKSNFNNCFNISCVNRGNNAFVSVNIQDKATGTWNASSVNQALLNGYSKFSVKKFAEALISLKQNESVSVKSDSMVSEPSTKCPQGTFGIGSKFTCSKCPPGAIFSSVKRTCEKCPNGTFSTKDSTECKKTTGPSPQNKKTCDNITCMSGKELDQTSGFCQWCPYDSYRNSSQVSAKCISCPNGKKTLYRGSLSVDDCHVPCNDGTFFDKSAKKCVLCPLGTFQNSTDHLTSWCHPCDNGKVTYSEGAKMLSDCLPLCTKGYFHDNQSKNCTKCPIGSYQNSTNQLKCQKCPTGTSTLTNGTSAISECKKTCQKGHYFDVQNMTCSNCSLGTYMDKTDHLFTSCLKCAYNKTTYVTGAVKEAQCLPICKPGHYYLSGYECTQCHIGSYQNMEKQQKCINCPNGTSTRQKGATKPSDCIKTCPEGSFYDEKNSSCSDCPLGTYMDNNRGHLETKCKKCGDKKTTYIKGAANASQCFPACNVGQYFGTDRSVCKDCPRGFYQMKPGQQSCVTCPPGMNTTRSGATSNLECIKIKVLCDQGEFFDPKKDICNLCENGTYQSAANHNLTACQSCLRGRTIGPGAKNVGDCVEGCDGFPCRNGAECTEKNQTFTCLCPKGITGRRCDMIEEKDKTQKLQAAVRFTSLEWSKALEDPSNKEYGIIAYKIEKALAGVFKKDDAFVGVQVTKLRPGSVIAEFNIYMNENMSLVPAKSLQHAVAEGSIGGLPVDSSFLNVTQVTCSQPLGMENGQIADKNIDNGSGKGRLKGVAWERSSTKLGFLQIQFDNSVTITSIASQGDGKGSFVKSYNVKYSRDGDAWKTSPPSNKSIKSYMANNDTKSVVKTTLSQPITSVKLIRVIPESYEQSIAMRVELYGCLSDPVLPISPPSTTAKPVEPETVKTKPNVEGVKGDKDDYAWGQYLGITFGLIMAVVVVVSCFLWWRSSRNKKQKEDTPLVLTRFQDGSYREIEREEEDDAV